MKLPLLCQMGWHRWEGFGARGWRLVEVCRRCQWLRWRTEDGWEWFMPTGITGEEEGRGTAR